MKLPLSLILLLVAVHTYSQTTVSGNVKGVNGEPVPGANIILEGTYDGTSSDENGQFSFTTEETGNRVLIVRFIGFKPLSQPISLNGSRVTLTIALEEEVNHLQAVTITAGSFTASDVSRRTIFRAVDIATTAGATADIAGALNTLPGTQKVGETGRLFVRGGDGNEAKTFIDGLVVLDAYGPAAPNTPSRGRFLPFMFKGTSFSTGGYSAEYGQALSSALVLDSKDESEITRTDIGLLSVGGDITHTKAWESGSIAGKIQYTNIRPYFGLINQEVDWKIPPASVEGITAFRQKVGRDGIVKFYGNFNQSSFSLYHHDIDDNAIRSLYDLDNRYRYLNGFYKGSINKNWSLRGGLAYSHIRNETAIDELEISEREVGLHAKGVLEGSFSRSVETKIGVEVIQRRYDQDFSAEVSETIYLGFNEWISSFFTESDIYLNNKFVTRVGGRLEYNALTSALALDPRISLAYKTGKTGQVSLAYGTFRQTARNEYVKVKHNLESERAEHFILNYQRIENNRTFRVETFLKRYEDLVKYSDPENLTSNGSGYAKGVELFWRDNRSLRNLDYWVSYSFLDTKRDYLNFPVRATPTFASDHNFSLVGKYFVRSLKSQLGATYSYTSGRPFNDPNEKTFNASRTPAYQDLSFNWSYLPKPYLILYFSITNLPGYDNVFGYEFSDVRNDSGTFNGRAIRQPAPRFLFVGIFLTLSKDKSVNQLPSL